MSNTNRDYVVVNDVKSGQIAIKRALKFYVTDKNMYKRRLECIS